jgi:hypothetical protein
LIPIYTNPQSEVYRISLAFSPFIHFNSACKHTDLLIVSLYSFIFCAVCASARAPRVQFTLSHSAVVGVLLENKSPPPPPQSRVRLQNQPAPSSSSKRKEIASASGSHPRAAGEREPHPAPRTRLATLRRQGHYLVQQHQQRPNPPFN